VRNLNSGVSAFVFVAEVGAESSHSDFVFAII
jgi:hypothetical protein